MDACQRIRCPILSRALTLSSGADAGRCQKGEIIASRPGVSTQMLEQVMMVIDSLREAPPHRSVRD